MSVSGSIPKDAILIFLEASRLRHLIDEPVVILRKPAHLLLLEKIGIKKGCHIKQHPCPYWIWLKSSVGAQQQISG